MPPAEQDIDLTPPTDEESGPNAPHPNETEAERDNGAAAAAPEEETEEWPDDADREPTGAAGAPTEPSPPSPPAEPTPATETSEPTPPPQAESEEPTAEVDGDEHEEEMAEDEEPPPAEEPTPPPAGRGASGAVKRGYTLLEEQKVVPLHALTDAQQKSAAKHAVTGYVPRAGDPIQGRNADIVLDQVYGDDGYPENVTAVLPLSERNFRPVEGALEPVQQHRLKLRRR